MGNQLDEKEFKIGYWWINHKKKILEIGKYIFFGADVILILIFIVNFYTYINHVRQTNEIASDIANQKINFSFTPPANMEIGQAYAIDAGNNKFDLVATITNPNDKWYAESFEYSFASSALSLLQPTSFILPGQTKTLVQTGVAAKPNSTQLVITNIRWKRVKEELIKTNFEFKDLKYSSSDAISMISGKVLNKSAFGFYQARAVIVLKYANQTQGVGVLNLTNFKSFEEKPLEIRFNKKFPFNIDIEPEIEVNILDKTNLIYPGQ